MKTFPWPLHLAVAAALLLGFVWFAHGTVSSEPYNYDESDYMFAASRGFWANWTDTPSQPLSEFIRIGLGRGVNPAQRLALSEAVRTSGDIVFYRHWHGPMFYYWLMLLSGGNEHFHRSMMLVFPAVTGLVIYFGLLWVLPSGGARLLPALFSAVIFLWSYALILSTELAPHQMFVLWVISALVVLAKFRQTGRMQWWYAAVALTALAAATLEVAFILVGALIVCGWLERARLSGWKTIWRSMAVLLGTVLVVWPSALFKLSFVKAYMFMVYLAVFRKAPWGNNSFLQTWIERLGNAPFEWIVLVVAFWAWWEYRNRPERRTATVFLVYAVLMLLLLLRVNATAPRYILPFLPAFHVFAGIMIGILMERQPARVLAILAVALCALRFGDTARYVLTRNYDPDPRPAAMIAEIRQRGLGDKRLLVPQEDLPTLHYYFPSANLSSYNEPQPPAVAPAADAVLQPGFPVRLDTTR